MSGLVRTERAWRCIGCCWMTCGQSAWFVVWFQTCTVIQSPPPPQPPPPAPCICSNQSVLWVWVSTFIPPRPNHPSSIYGFLLVNLNVLRSETAEESCTLVFYLFYVLLLWDCLQVTVVRNWQDLFLFHCLWKVIKVLTSWNCLNGILFIENPIYIKIYRLSVYS